MYYLYIESIITYIKFTFAFYSILTSVVMLGYMFTDFYVQQVCFTEKPKKNSIYSL